MPLVDGLKLAPSILAADFARLGQQVQEAEQAGADWLHIDIMDGHFVPPITMGPLAVEAVRRSCSLLLDVHLMIEQPEQQFGPLKDAGADLLCIHSEATRHIHRLLRSIKDLGLRTGLALNPATPEAALPEVLHLTDMVLVMTIDPGWGGQQLLPSTRPKLRRIRTLIDRSGRDIELEVDGGVNASTIDAMRQDGASVVVAGTGVFNDREPVAAAVERLRLALR